MERNSFLIVSKEVLTDKRIPATARLLLAQLLDHRNKKTGQCNPNQTTLARELGMSLRTVERGIATLKRNEYIKIIRGQTGCRYEFPTRQTGGSETADMAGGNRQSGGWEHSGPLYEPYIREPSTVRAQNPRAPGAVFPNKYKNSTPPATPRKSMQSEILEAYYREERRRAGKL